MGGLLSSSPSSWGQNPQLRGPEWGSPGRDRYHMGIFNIPMHSLNFFDQNLSEKCGWRRVFSTNRKGLVAYHHYILPLTKGISSHLLLASCCFCFITVLWSLLYFCSSSSSSGHNITLLAILALLGVFIAPDPSPAPPLFGGLSP